MNVAQFASSSARGDLRTEPRLIRFVIVAIAVIFLTVFVVLPLVVVFAQAFSKGIGAYFAALADPEALSAIRLTLMVAVISVSLNLLFGLVAAWAISKFDFRGKTLLILADRSAVLGQPGDFRSRIRAAVRRAGILGAVAAKP